MRTIRRGDIFWVQPSGGTRFVHPHVVIQDTVVNQSRIETTVVCGLSTNMKRAFLPGNILLRPGEAGLPKQSVVVVSQISTVRKGELGEYIGSLSRERVDELFAGMEFLQHFTEREVRE